MGIRARVPLVWFCSLLLVAAITAALAVASDTVYSVETNWSGNPNPDKKELSLQGCLSTIDSFVGDERDGMWKLSSNARPVMQITKAGVQWRWQVLVAEAYGGTTIDD